MQTKIINLLKEYGLKVTPQRITLLSTIENKGHANIDEIYNEVKISHPSISLATVYKNITSLIEKGLLKELPITNSKSKYEIIKEQHSHFICQKCGQIDDITLDVDIQKDCNSLAQNSNFKIGNIELNIYGICKKCQ